MATSANKLSERISSAARVMGVKDDVVRKSLEEIGICLVEPDTDGDGLALLEAETTMEKDAEPFFLSMGVKISRFKAGWAILKGRGAKITETRDSDTISDLVKSFKPLSQYSDKELLSQYGPDCSSEIVDQLKKRSYDRPFVIYLEDGLTMDEVNTLEMLRLSRRQETKTTHVVNKKLENGSYTNRPVRVYQAGEFPCLWLEESPIHSNVILVDGYCDKCQISWKKVKDKDRVIVRVAAMVNALSMHLSAIHDLATRIIAEDSAEFILNIPAVKMLYQELEENGRLPVLRKRPSTSSSGVKDPFFTAHHSH